MTPVKLSKEKPADHASNFYTREWDLKRKRPEARRETGHILNDNHLEKIQHDTRRSLEEEFCGSVK